MRPRGDCAVSPMRRIIRNSAADVVSHPIEQGTVLLCSQRYVTMNAGIPLKLSIAMLPVQPIDDGGFAVIAKPLKMIIARSCPTLI